MALPTVDDLKTHLNLTDDTHDTELGTMLDAAIEVVEGLIGPLDLTPVTERHRHVNSDHIILQRMPVGSLTAVSSVTYGVESPYTVTDFDLDTDTGILRSTYGYWLTGDFAVTYTTGRYETPAAVRLAVLIIAAHLWETQRMPGFQSSDSLPAGFGGADGIQDASPIGTGYAIPNRALELLRPHLLGRQIA